MVSKVDQSQLAEYLATQADCGTQNSEEFVINLDAEALANTQLEHNPEYVPDANGDPPRSSRSESEDGVGDGGYVDTLIRANMLYAGKAQFDLLTKHLKRAVTAEEKGHAGVAVADFLKKLQKTHGTDIQKVCNSSPHLARIKAKNIQHPDDDVNMVDIVKCDSETPVLDAKTFNCKWVQIRGVTILFSNFYFSGIAKDAVKDEQVESGIDQANKNRARQDRANAKFEQVQDAVDRGDHVQAPPEKLNDRRGARKVLTVPTEVSNNAYLQLFEKLMLPGDGKDGMHWGHHDGNNGGCPGTQKVIDRANRTKAQAELDAEYEHHRKELERQACVLSRLQDS